MGRGKFKASPLAAAISPPLKRFHVSEGRGTVLENDACFLAISLWALEFFHIDFPNEEKSTWLKDLYGVHTRLLSEAADLVVNGIVVEAKFSLHEKPWESERTKEKMEEGREELVLEEIEKKTKERKWW
ncbi:hypothetical protein Pfo_016370 [Paulownia fortunei]|nr:hypothetical protein Pfo_016370 [Paulownia fortunei]